MAESAGQPDWSVEATAEAEHRLSRYGCMRARLELTAPDAGGRRHAVQSGWVAAWEIDNGADGQRPDNDAMVVPEGQTAIEPGGTALVRIFPMTPHRWARVRVGDVIGMRDGARRIGSARVLEIVGPTSEQPAVNTWPVASAEPGSARDVEGAVWQVLDYDEAWGPFEAAFNFRPNYYEGSAPAIRIPEGAVVVDLRPVFASPGARFAAGEAAVNAASARAFVWVCGDEELTALDWQHTPYRYSPARHVLAGAEWKVPVFPNGDYYVHTTSDLRLGTFGHPWQEWLCVWGEQLVDSLGAELLTWLPQRALLAD